ncbi:response regulator transcription factor [Nonomuraea pusilla]|uniref:response regulator transcription factor n=1 Tax=Nonomuraea pusilla TaxID=46177 RepID=UPI0033221BD9
MTIRVLIADDHEVVRQGLRFVLEQEDGVEVAGESEDGARALAAVRALRPDVLLLDMVMPVVDGLGVLRALRDEPGRPAVIVLTSFHEDDRVVEAMRLGALSYLPKTAGVDRVVAAVRAAAEGGSALGRETVKTHVSSILAKLGVADRTQAAIVALQQGLVPLDEALG